MELIRDNWTKNDYDDFVEELRSYADEKYRSFHSSLIPDNEGFFIGVRMPVMRKLGKEISKGNGRSFLEQTTDNSYEEKTMRGIVIGLLKTESYEEFLMYSDDFVQRIDSWAVCDGFCANLKETKKYKSENHCKHLLSLIRIFYIIKSCHRHCKAERKQPCQKCKHSDHYL